MEQTLDDIAAGELPWKQQLERFYFGDGADHPGLEQQIATQEPRIEYPAMEVGRYPESGAPIVVRIGRYGPYLQIVGDETDRISASLPEDLAPADLTEEVALEIIARAQRGSHLLGHDEAGLPVYLAHGRFGPYVQLGETPERGSKQPKPKRASLPQGVEEESVTLERALVWLSLPRSLGEHPESGEEVIAASGRYGPFLKCGDETRSLPRGDDVYSVDLERALEILAQPKGRRGRGRASRKVIRVLGKDAGGNEVQLLEGFYGPYLTNGELNASLPKGIDPQQLSPEEAARLLADRGKPPKRKRKKS
jgi:DNA topoisomerase-1